MVLVKFVIYLTIFSTPYFNVLVLIDVYCFLNLTKIVHRSYFKIYANCNKSIKHL